MPRIPPPHLKLDFSIISTNKPNPPQTEAEKLKVSLTAHQQQLKSEKLPIINVENQRYNSIDTLAATAINAPNGTNLPANHISLGTTKGIIRSQYPTIDGVDVFKAMLAEKRVTVLVVIGEDHILNSPLNEKPYPIYFKNTKDSHNDMVSLTEFKNVSLPYNVPVECFKLKLENKQKINNIGEPIGIPVIHVNQWPDKTSLSVDQLEELAKYVNTVSSNKYSIYKNGGSRAVELPQKALPVIHCSAGVGRTGQLIVAMELINTESRLSLESIIKTLREHGGYEMVQDNDQTDQMTALFELAERCRKPLRIKDERP